MADEKEYVSREKFEELQKELDFLKKNKRKEVAENLEYAKSLGDLAENAEYHEARETQANLEDRIAKLEAMLKTVIVADATAGDKINFGSKVTIQKDGTDEKNVFVLVGAEESDVPGGKISIHSPIGEALLGKKKGEKATVHAPRGAVVYKIIDVA